MDMSHAQIIETQRDGHYTGHYRLIGVPGNFLELPGRGGDVTRRAAKRALGAFAAGQSNQEAARAAWEGRE